MDKELELESWQSWEETTKHFKEGVNPAAYTLGYKTGATTSSRVKKLDEKIKELEKEKYHLQVQGDFELIKQKDNTISQLQQLLSEKEKEMSELKEKIKWMLRSYSESYKNQDKFLEDISKEIGKCYCNPNGSHSKLMKTISEKYLLINKSK